jgi:beta-lactam-binding protein with PASTA domain
MLTEELGLKAEVIELAGSKGIVTGQRPEAGARIESGKTVYLYFGREDSIW